MQMLEAFVLAFFKIFGITQPSDQTRRRAAWFTLTLLLLTVGGIATLAALAFHVMR